MNFIVVWKGDPIRDMSTCAKSIYPSEVWDNYLEIEILVARADTHQVVWKEKQVAPTIKGLSQEEIEEVMKRKLEEFEELTRMISPRPITGLLSGKDSG